MLLCCMQAQGAQPSWQSSLARKSFFGLVRTITQPRTTFSWILRGHLAKDPVFVSQSSWYTGTLQRVPLAELIPATRDVELVLPRAFDRKFGTSITAEEACHLAAITSALGARRILEIGTFDGNTALVLAANMKDPGEVVTVDLPPDFAIENRESLTYLDGEFNLTPRTQLARQYRSHPLSSRIRQVYGDSAALDWSTLGGPFDLVFIDGCHSEDYVRADSLHAMQVLNAGGVVIWHDYGAIPEVSKVVDQLASESPALSVHSLEGTRLAIGFAGK